MSVTEYTAKVGFVKFVDTNLAVVLKQATDWVNDTQVDDIHTYVNITTDYNRHANNPMWELTLTYYS